MNIKKSKFQSIIFVGLDVHKNSISLAARSFDRGLIVERVFSTKDLGKLRKFLYKLNKQGSIRCVYEACGAGFFLQRKMQEWEITCEIAASSLIPQKPGDKRKNDKLDARMLAEYYQAGLLTMVCVPSAEIEGARGVVRCRQAFRKKVTQVKHQITKFLHTKGVLYSESSAWCGQHRDWLSKLRFDCPEDDFTFTMYLKTLRYLESSLEELDRKIELLSKRELFKEPVRYLRAFRGVQTLTAMVLVTELADVRRFKSPRHLMSYVGLTPSVRQSGDSGNKAGSITKAGSARCRHVLIQAAWCNIKRPNLSRDLRLRQAGLPAWVIDDSWRAQERLCKRFRHLEITKGRPKAIVAVARELIGFLGCTLHKMMSESLEAKN
jgi:transposase